jgi:glycerol uptake facilitator-like aquaporin
VPFAVAAYISAAYWFTASTSFANPAVTLARSASDTFAGIRPTDVPAFIFAQLAGAGAATALFRWLGPVLYASPGTSVVASTGGEDHAGVPARAELDSTGRVAASADVRKKRRSRCPET